MKTIYLIGVILFVCVGESTLSFAQKDTGAVSFVAYWKMNETHHYKVTKIKLQLKDSAVVKTDTTLYDVTFKVVDSTANSYTISWMFANDLTNIYQIPDTTFQKFAKYQTTNVIYTTNEMGAFQEIKNWKEIGDLMKDMFTDLAEYQELRFKLKNSELQKAMDSYTQVYGSKQGIEQLVFKEIQYFHFPLGLGFKTNEAVLYEEQLPNMFGGDPIKGNGKIYFESIDRKKSRCVMIQQMSINPEDTRKIMKQVFTNMSLNDEEMQEAFKTAVFQITDNNRYDYDFHNGWPIKIETVRKTKIDLDNEKSDRIDKIVIELLD